jgi:hypothetical protein
MKFVAAPEILRQASLNGARARSPVASTSVSCVCNPVDSCRTIHNLCNPRYALPLGLLAYIFAGCIHRELPMLYKIRLVPRLGAQSPESLRAARRLGDAGVNAEGITLHRLFLIEGEIPLAQAGRIVDLSK